jgi:hypothetical protein
MRVYLGGGWKTSGECVIVLPISRLTGKQGCGATYLGGITEVLRMVRRKRGGQTSLCSMAERVAALREVTPSLL